MAPSLPPPGTLVNARYTVVEKLGEGSMGAVFLATQTGGKRWALKFLTVDGHDAEATDRFLREARVASQLASDHLVQVVDFGVDRASGLLFLVMPIVQGGDLEALLGQVGALPPVVAVRIAMQAAEGMAAAHATGVIHRDLKPSNLMITAAPGGGEEFLKVLDLGIAKKIRDDAAGTLNHQTVDGAFMGTVPYAAPEQIGGQADSRSDIYSIGVILYQLLTGHLPFTGIWHSMLAATINVEPPTFAEKAPGLAISPAIESLVHRCLAKDPEERPQSARQLAEDFRRAIAWTVPDTQEAVVAAPPPDLPRMRT